MTISMQSVASILLAIFVMAAVTYLLRALPLTLVRRKITNRYVRAFLDYVPYAVLAAMTIPDIFTCTAMLTSAVIGLAVAVLLAFLDRKLMTVALGAVAAVFIAERLLAMAL